MFESSDRNVHIEARKEAVLLLAEGLSPDIKGDIFATLSFSLGRFGKPEEIAISNRMYDLLDAAQPKTGKDGGATKDSKGNQLCDITLDAEICSFFGLKDKDGNLIKSLLIKGIPKLLEEGKN